MANKCLICQHENRLEIDREIVNRRSLTSISQKYGVAYWSLQLHAKEHISRQLSQAWEKRDLEQNHSLLAKIDGIIDRAEKIFTRNYDAGKDGIALKALDSQRQTIELLAKISYSLHQAKVAELELKRVESGSEKEEMQQLYRQNLQILTTPELNVFNKLITKITKQSNQIIIKDTEANSSDFMSDVEPISIKTHKKKKVKVKRGNHEIPRARRKKEKSIKS